MSEDPLAQTIADLRKQASERRSIAADHRFKAAEYQAAAATEEAAAKRLDAAIAGLAEPAVTEVRVVAEVPPQFGSVRSMLLRLLAEDDRDWSTAEILQEYDHRGMPVHGKDPSNALRAAIYESKKAGQIYSTGTGRYRSIKWLAEQGAMDAGIALLPDTPAAALGTGEGYVVMGS